MHECVRYLRFRGSSRGIRYDAVNVSFGVLLLLSLVAGVNGACGETSGPVDCTVNQGQNTVQTLPISIGATVGSLVFIVILSRCVIARRRAQAAAIALKLQNTPHRAVPVQMTRTPVLPLHIRQADQDIPRESQAGWSQPARQTWTPRIPAPAPVYPPVVSTPSPDAPSVQYSSVTGPAIASPPSPLPLPPAPPPPSPPSPAIEHHTPNNTAGTSFPTHNLPYLPTAEIQLPAETGNADSDTLNDPPPAYTFIQQ